MAVKDADGDVGAIGNHAVALEVAKKARAARRLPAMLELHRDLIHLADRARQILFIRFGKSAGLFSQLRVGRHKFGVGAGNRHAPNAGAHQQGQRGSEQPMEQVPMRATGSRSSPLMPCVRAALMRLDGAGADAASTPMIQAAKGDFFKDGSHECVR